MAYNKKQKLQDNIEAIRVAFQCEAENRHATTREEIKALQKYSGFGGLKFILNDANGLSDSTKWSKSDMPYFAATLQLHRLIKENSKNNAEYKEYMQSLRTSVLTSFYTPQSVVDAIADSLKNSGVEIKRFLEPSAGQGVFVDSFLRNGIYPGAETLAFEKDLLTGKILSALHPSITTEISGFEKIDPDFEGYFDVAASNIPFGDFAVADPRYASSKEIAYRQSTKAIHNYFFLKTLDSVREGGIVAFITSQGVMNSASPFVRMEILRRSDLVAAIRLPNNTFSENSGTDVGSDLIILQKHTNKKALSADEEFFVQSIVDRETKTPNNKYFSAYPQNIICSEAKVGKDQYGKPAIIYKHEGGVEGIASDLRRVLDESLNLRLNVDLYNNQGLSSKEQSTPEKLEKTQTEEKITKSKEENLPATQKIQRQNAPLLQQYKEMKKKHPDAILLFRVGDFYETFGNDAVMASDILGLTLVRRQDGIDNRIELAGFPHHALDTYLPKLVRAGKRVAICEQLEDPKLSKKTVKRGSNEEKSETKKNESVKEDLKKTDNKEQKSKESVKPEKEQVTPKVKKTEEPGIDYSNNPDPRMFQYNLFGELEPVANQQNKSRRKSASETKQSYAPKPSESVNTEKPKAVVKVKPVEVSNTKGAEVDNSINKDIKETTTTRLLINNSLVDYAQQEVYRGHNYYGMAGNGAMVLQNGKLGLLSAATDKSDDEYMFNPIDISPYDVDKAKKYLVFVELLGMYNGAVEAHDDTLALDVRDRLNDTYNDFVESYGYLHSNENEKFIRMDVNGPDVLDLEFVQNGKIMKSGIIEDFECFDPWINANMSVLPEYSDYWPQMPTLAMPAFDAVDIIPTLKETDLFSSQIESPKVDIAPIKDSALVDNDAPRNENKVIPEVESRGRRQVDLNDLKPMEMKSYDVQPYFKEGSLIAYHGRIGYVSQLSKHGATFNPLKLDDEQLKRADLYTSLKLVYNELYLIESTTKKESALRGTLNNHYADFVNSFGHINDKENIKLIRMDADGRDMLALERNENGVFVKADIFDHPVSFTPDNIISVDSPLEALTASLNRFGEVNMDYMSDLLNVDSHEYTVWGGHEFYFLNKLEGHIYYNPLSDKYEPKDRFIAGNVVKKADEIKAWVDKEEKRINNNAGYDGMEPWLDASKESLAALEKAIPRKITFEELDFNFGERWIPSDLYSRYMSDLYETKVHVDYTSSLDQFSSDAPRKNMKIWDEFCVRGYYRVYDGIALLNHALHNTVPDIKKSIGKDDEGHDIKVPDSEAIQLANSKIDTIRNGFSEWLQNQPQSVKDDLVDLYNSKFNCYVRPSYDGSHQTFPELDFKGLGEKLHINSIYQSQKDCIWMLKQNGGGICDHEVGTGKTLIMCIAAHEMKRLGTAHKPLIIGMKANVAAIANTYKVAYPNAKILYADEKTFKKENRLDFFRQIKNNDFDCIIMSHDQFGKIPQSPDIQHQILKAELDSVEENLNVVKEKGGEVSRSMLKGLLKRKENLTAKMANIQFVMNNKTDDVIDFKQMGIDHIFVDESQNFKNLMFNTRHDRVAGLGNSEGSQRSLNLLYAIRTIQERSGKDLGATFLSGTTVSNSLTELYSIFKYLRPNELENQEIRCFNV